MSLGGPEAITATPETLLFQVALDIFYRESQAFNVVGELFCAYPRGKDASVLNQHLDATCLAYSAVLDAVEADAWDDQDKFHILSKVFMHDALRRNAALQQAAPEARLLDPVDLETEFIVCGEETLSEIYRLHSVKERPFKEFFSAKFREAIIHDQNALKQLTVEQQPQVTRHTLHRRGLMAVLAVTMIGLGAADAIHELKKRKI